MLLTIIMPEYLLGRALSDLVDANRFKKSTKEQGLHKWTMTHGYYANMGGFIFSLPSIPIPNPDHSNWSEHEISDSTSEPRLPAGGKNSSGKEGAGHSSAHEHKTSPIGPIAINATQLNYLLKEKILNEEPPISKNEIWDKSKGDVFAKISAVVQLIWLVTQLITRKVLNLPSAQLEILALAFAVCTIFTWIIYWSKPQNILSASNISYHEPTCKGRDFSDLEERLEEDVSASFFKNALLPDSKDPRDLEAIIRNDKTNVNSNFHEFNKDKPYVWYLDAESVGFQIGAVILGVCHCLAWNFEFPTHIERILWRIASVSITGIMPIFYFLWCLLSHWSDKLNPHFEHFKLPLSWLSYTFYIVARLYLLVAPFRELFFLPPRVFIATWSALFPHFS